MLKLIKWIYDLGHRQGWDKAVEQYRKGHELITSAESKQQQFERDMMDKILREQSTTPNTSKEKE